MRIQGFNPFHRRALSELQLQPKRAEATIGEKGLYIINDDREWQKLKEHLRTSGARTNISAKFLVFDYLNQMQEKEQGFGFEFCPKRTPPGDRNRITQISPHKNIATRRRSYTSPL